MPKNIQNIVDAINFEAGKRDTGYFNPTDIVRAVNLESDNLYNKFIEEFARTRRVSEHLHPFMTNSSIPITTGAGTVPADFAHANLVLSGNEDVEIVELHQWGTRLTHKNHPPTTDYPICKFEAAVINVEPQTVTPVILHYFILPTQAVYAFTISSNRYIYDDANSIDFEWRTITHGLIIERTMSKLGISIKDRDLVNYSESQKVEEEFIK